MTHPDTRPDLTRPHDGSERSASQPLANEHPTVRTWLTVVGCVLTAAGFGTYLAFASEQADRENAGEVVPTSVEAGVAIGTVLLLAGFVALVWEGFRRARHQGWRVVPRIAGQIGLGLLSMVAGFVVMLIVVRTAFG